jgi:hypothetical protein
MLCHLYVRAGIAYIPTAAKTEAGYYLDIEPVEVTAVSNSVAFDAALKRAINRGHPVVPTPTRMTFPRPVILKYAKARSINGFERGATYWQLTKENELYKIGKWKKRPQGGWVPDPTREQTMRPRATLGDATKRLVERVQSDA